MHRFILHIIAYILVRQTTGAAARRLLCSDTASAADPDPSAKVV